MRTGSSNEATTSLPQRLGMDRSTLERGLTAFAETMVAQGLLAGYPGAPA